MRVRRPLKLFVVYPTYYNINYINRNHWNSLKERYLKIVCSTDSVGSKNCQRRNLHEHEK